MRAASSSLSLPLPLFIPPRACLHLSYLFTVEARSLSPALSLPLLRSSLRPLPSPPAPAAVRARAFASATSRTNRSLTRVLAIPLPRVARPPSVCVRVSHSLSSAASYALFRGARPGEARV